MKAVLIWQLKHFFSFKANIEPWLKKKPNAFRKMFMDYNSPSNSVKKTDTCLIKWLNCLPNLNTMRNLQSIFKICMAIYQQGLNLACSCDAEQFASYDEIQQLIKSMDEELLKLVSEHRIHFRLMLPLYFCHH